MDAQYLKQFSQYLADQQGQLKELNEEFSRFDAALSMQGEHQQEELDRQLSDLHTAHEEASGKPASETCCSIGGRTEKGVGQFGQSK